MRKKIVSLFTLFSFLIFSFSCYSTLEKKEIRMTVDDAKSTSLKIISVQTNTGAHIEFRPEFPVVIFGDSIQGYKTITVSQADVKEIILKDGKISEIETMDGERLQYLYKRSVSSPTQKSDRVDGYVCKKKISFPLSEIELVWVEKMVEVQKLDGATIGLVIALALVTTVLIVAISTSSFGISGGSSCAFIYSYDGENYILDAEPYGGAYARGLQRADWCTLENLKEIDGKYSILVSNELEETQYTDELKLITVDHPKGIKVAPDPSGKIHTLRNLVAPVSAHDKKGRDLLPLVAEIDRVMWLSQEEERNEDSLREELIFEFPKPIEAQKAKLVVNAQTTLWGSEVAKRYIELYGDDVNKYFQDINSHGPAYSSNIMMNLREELYGLQIRVETDKGWETKEIIRGGNPLISENVVYNLDLGDVTGETLKIKLTPPAAFWMINFLALDYTEDLPLTLTELEAAEAVDHTGQDVREMFAATDGKYQVMPNIGDSVNVVFESTPRKSGMERTVFLKANGYYNIHLQAEGTPQHELIRRLQRESGFALQYAHQEYLQWKKELAQKDKLQ